MEMEMEFLRKLPTPQELKEQFPVSTEVVAVKAQRDEEIRNIFEGKDDRLILVIGPCSADNEDAVIDYISRLRTVQEKVKDKIFIIPRIRFFFIRKIMKKKKPPDFHQRSPSTRSIKYMRIRNTLEMRQPAVIVLRP